MSTAVEEYDVTLRLEHIGILRTRHLRSYLVSGNGQALKTMETTRLAGVTFDRRSASWRGRTPAFLYAAVSVLHMHSLHAYNTRIAKKKNYKADAKVATCMQPLERGLLWQELESEVKHLLRPPYPQPPQSATSLTCVRKKWGGGRESFEKPRRTPKEPGVETPIQLRK